MLPCQPVDTGGVRRAMMHDDQTGTGQQHRQFSRISFHNVTTVIQGGKSFPGEVTSLSLHGAYISLPQPIPVGETVEIDIDLTSNYPDLHIYVTGQVVRQSDDGIGVIFSRMDADSFIHLRNVVAYNFREKDVDKVMEEFFRYVSQQAAKQDPLS